MIVRQSITLWNVLFSYRLSIMRKIWPRVALTTSIAVLATFTEVFQGTHIAGLTATPFSLIGVALGIFLGFRTNASYDRFWEGRKLWGRLVNVARTFTRQVQLYVRPGEDDEAFRREIAGLTIAFVHALRGLLRGTDVEADLRRLLDAETFERVAPRRNRPNALAQEISARLRAAWEQGRVEDYHLASLDRSLEEFTSIQGGCERILNTPLPFSYSFLIHRITAFYCLLLPFGIAGSVGAPTPLVTLLTSYAFFGLDAIGDEVEDPFGSEPNDLPLDALSRSIEIETLRMIGESNVPEPLGPVDEILI